MFGPFAIPLAVFLAVVGAYGYGVISTKYRVQAELERIYNDRIASLKREYDNESKRLADEAKKARDEVGPTPDDLAELRSLCQRDPACRDRNKN